MVRSFGTGALVGVTITGLLTMLIVIVVDPERQRVLIALRDIPAGEAVSADALEAVLVPSLDVNDSNVPQRQRRKVLGLPVAFNVKAGDPITWQLFARTGRTELLEDCISSNAPKVAGAAAEVLRKARRTPRGGAAPQVAFDLPAPDGVFVRADRDYREGERITEGALTTGKVDPRLVTASLVPARYAPVLTGLTLNVPLARGDPVRWVFLDADANAPSPAACVHGLTAEVRRSVEEAAGQAAIGYASEHASARGQVGR